MPYVMLQKIWNVLVKLRKTFSYTTFYFIAHAHRGQEFLALLCIIIWSLFSKCIVYCINPIWDGGGGKNYPPLAKILNNTKFGQAEGLPELLTEQNLVLHVFWKFQVISLVIYWNITSFCHVTGKFCWMKYHLFAIKLVIDVHITWNFASRLGLL